MPRPPLFNINDRLEIYDPASKKYFKTIIQEAGADRLVIGIPMLNRRALPLKQGSSWLLRMVVPNDAVYIFRSRVLQRLEGRRLPYYVIERPVKLIRKQLRDYVRLKLNFNLEYAVLGNEAQALLDQPATAQQTDGEQPPFIKARGIDISGGGLLMVTRHQVAVASLLQLRFALKEDNIVRRIALVGRVAWVNHDRQSGHYRCGVQFVNITESTREYIIQYIFRLMRRMIKL